MSHLIVDLPGLEAALLARIVADLELLQDGRRTIGEVDRGHLRADMTVGMLTLEMNDQDH